MPTKAMHLDICTGLVSEKPRPPGGGGIDYFFLKKNRLTQKVQSD